MIGVGIGPLTKVIAGANSVSAKTISVDINTVLVNIQLLDNTTGLPLKNAHVKYLKVGDAEYILNHSLVGPLKKFFEQLFPSKKYSHYYNKSLGKSISSGKM